MTERMKRLEPRLYWELWWDENCTGLEAIKSLQMQLDRSIHDHLMINRYEQIIWKIVETKQISNTKLFGAVPKPNNVDSIRSSSSWRSMKLVRFPNTYFWGSFGAWRKKTACSLLTTSDFNPFLFVNGDNDQGSFQAWLPAINQMPIKRWC